MAERPQAEDKAGTAPACPICGRPSDERYRPFCSGRCADIDLQGWFSGRYVIPGAGGSGSEHPDDGEDG